MLKSSVVEALQVGRQGNTAAAGTRRAMAFLRAIGAGHETTTRVGQRTQLCEAGDSRPVMDGIERRFDLGASEHRDEVSEASITACHLLSDGSLPGLQGAFDNEI